MIKFVMTDEDNYINLPIQLKNDPEVAMKFISHADFMNKGAIETILSHSTLGQNKDFIIQAIGKLPYIFESQDPRVPTINDRECVLAYIDACTVHNLTITLPKVVYEDYGTQNPQAIKSSIRKEMLEESISAQGTPTKRVKL